MQQFLVLQHLWAQHCKEHPLILITSLRKSTDNVISNSRLSRRRVLNIFDTSTLLVVVVVYVVAVATDSGSCWCGCSSSWSSSSTSSWSRPNSWRRLAVVAILVREPAWGAWGKGRYVWHLSFGSIHLYTYICVYYVYIYMCIHMWIYTYSQKNKYITYPVIMMSLKTEGLMLIYYIQLEFSSI